MNMYATRLMCAHCGRSVTAHADWKPKKYYTGRLINSSSHHPSSPKVYQVRTREARAVCRAASVTELSEAELGLSPRNYFRKHTWRVASRKPER